MLYSVSMVCETFLSLLFLIFCSMFRTHFVFGHEVVREVTSRMYQPTPPFSGVSFCFCLSFAVPRVGMHSQSHIPLKVERKVGGRLHLKLNKCLRPITNKYFEGQMQRTLKRE